MGAVSAGFVRSPVIVRWFVAVWVALATVASGSKAWAQAPSLAAGSPGGAAVGFSNLIVRIEGDDEIGIADQDFRVVILEALRKAGFRAVGAENLVFNKDRANQADYVLGGTVRELECRKKDPVVSCRVGVEWQLLDVRRDAVVYTTLARAAERDVPVANPGSLARTLVLDALRFLTLRPKFRGLLSKEAAPDAVPDPRYASAAIRRCPTPPKDLPAGAEPALRATVLIQGRDRFGSGFLVTPDGLVLTAAHVANARDLSVRLRDGTVLKAQVVRRAPAIDAALVRVAPPSDLPMQCLALNLEPKTVGNEVYAIGSPASEKLAFSLTRGIVSGVRDFDGRTFLQTDASISPGNSGGPLIDKQGKAAGIVSWKVAGRSVEGVAFGVPVEDALRVLALTPGADTDGALLRGKPLDPEADTATKPFVDIEDPIPSIDGSAERTALLERIAEQRRADEKQAILGDKPASSAQVGSRGSEAPYVGVVRVVGGTAFVVGVAGLVYTYASFDSGSSSQDGLYTLNTASWIATGVGAAAFGITFVLPNAANSRSVKATGIQSAALSVAPGRVSLSADF
jgi:S1-C subfamily serine protease